MEDCKWAGVCVYRYILYAYILKYCRHCTMFFHSLLLLPLLLLLILLLLFWSNCLLFKREFELILTVCVIWLRWHRQYTILYTILKWIHVFYNIMEEGIWKEKLRKMLNEDDEDEMEWTKFCFTFLKVYKIPRKKSRKKKLNILTLYCYAI